MQVTYAAVVADSSIREEQVGEICAPLPVGLSCAEILLQLIAEDVMWFPMLISGLFGTDDRAEPKFRIHIFMYGKPAQHNAIPFEVKFHGAISIHLVMGMVNLSDFALYRFFLGIITCLPMFQEAVISVRANTKPPEKPAHAKDTVMLFYESISL